MEFFNGLFGSGDFQPHGFCYQWNTGLVWLNVVSDFLIALAYFTIPVTLVWFIRKRRDVPFSWMFGLFGVFIVACGSTHLMEVWNLWHAQYWIAGVLKAITAAVSIPTAILLGRIVPQALDLPSNTQWIEANAALQKEVHDRRELEIELRMSEANYRENAELLDLTHDAIFARDANGEIIYWNKAAERLYGWTKEEIGERPSHQLLQTVFPKPLAEIEAEVAKSGFWGGELTHTRRDGSTVVVSSRWTLRTGGGKPIAILESNRDITERKQAEEARELHRKELARSNAEMSSANKELEAFSYSVSHDLRAPLRAIDGFSMALLEDYSDRLDDEGKGHLQRVRAATQHMGELIDDMLNLARVSRVSMRLEKVNLSGLAGEITEDLKKTHPERPVEFRIGEGLEGKADSHLLRVVLDNLIGNAWKFTSKRPSAHIEFGRFSDNGTSAFFVRDDGAGFDPAYADRLFGAFQRLHTASEFPGTGIGLATVQRIIHRHGGRVWAQSSVGQGATFYFTLPGVSS